MAQPRLAALDALRGLAALAVVLFHYIPYYHELYGHDFSPPFFLEFGRYGVHLFFLLSGFVIFMTLERTRSATMFGMARAVRLLPALWAGILLTWLTVHWLGPADRAVSLGTALMNATLLHEYLGLAHVDGAYWSLVIEATFYVWIAVIFHSLREWSRIRVVLMAWTALAWAFALWPSMFPDSLEFLIKDLLFIKYAPLFFGGMVLYRWHRYGRPPATDLALFAACALHALVAYKAPFNVFVLGCYGVFGAAVAGWLNILATRPLLWLGSMSYALYLVHQNIGYGIISWSYQQGFPGWSGIALALATAMGLAAVLHYAVEKPALSRFRKWRERNQQKVPSPGSLPPPVRAPGT